jgi:hypothetical protein
VIGIVTVNGVKRRSLVLARLVRRGDGVTTHQADYEQTGERKHVGTARGIRCACGRANRKADMLSLLSTHYGLFYFIPFFLLPRRGYSHHPAQPSLMPIIAAQRTTGNTMTELFHAASFSTQRAYLPEPASYG